ncbi:MAG TPA: DUF1731 domain-containing protein [Pedococcus sp.]
MVWRRTSRAVLALDRGTVWEVLADLRRWPEWNPGLQRVTVEGGGPVAPGRTGHLVPAGPLVGAVHARTAPPFGVVEVDPGTSLVLEQPQPGGALRVAWRLSDADDEPGGTLLQQRVEVRGPLTPAATAALAEPLARDFPLSAARLHRLASGGTPRPDALRVVVAGGSGTLGRPLASDLQCRGHDVVVLTRRLDPHLPFRQREWDGRTVGAWATELEHEGPTAVVNLAGRLVDCRPTPDNIAALRTSRVEPTRALVAASQRRERPLEHWLQASTTAIWSDAGETRCDERTPVPAGLPQMTGVALPWEQALEGAHTRHAVVLRTSLVLDRDAPVLDRLLGLTRAGLGGPIAGGQQWVSWIHVEDWLRVARAALGLVPGLEVPPGVVVAASDHPVRNHELMATLRRQVGRPWAPPTPAPLLRLGGVLLRTDPALGLTGRHATSRVLREAGFTYRHPHLPEALADLLG